MNGYLAETFARYGTEMWCDSPNPPELQRMLDLGVSGVTSNPVLVYRTTQAASARWQAEIAACKAEGGLASWNMTKRVVKEAAAMLYPIYEATHGQRGLICIQVDPRNWNDPAAMLAQAKEANAVAPNIAVKVPVTKAGVVAIEELAANGINCTATVSFTVPQAVAIAEAFKRGKARAQAAGILQPGRPLHSYAVLMVGRLDDHLRDVVKEQGIDVDPKLLTYAGNAVGKKAYKLYKERGYESKLMIAALRGNYHIDQYIGGDLIITMPPASEIEFGKATGEKLSPSRIDEEIPAAKIDELGERFPDFQKAYLEDGMRTEEFETFGSTVKTLNQFIGAWESLIKFVG